MEAPATPRISAESRARAVLRHARRFATPAAIVFAWTQVVRTWGDSEVELYNWATITAGAMLAVVTVAWLLSLRFRKLRRALLPLEGGIVVGSLVLALSTTGREVDTLGDFVAIAVVFGVITTILLGIVLPLVEGRRRAWAWTGGTIALVAAAGVALPAALDWLEGDIYAQTGDGIATSELLLRLDEDGFRLGDTYLYTPASTLRDGYGHADPFGPAPLGIDAPGEARPEQVRSDWARLLARPDGSVQLVVDRGIAAGLDAPVVASLRRGSCQTAAAARGIDEFRVPPSTTGHMRRAFAASVDELRLGDEYSVVVGIDAPLAPTRCLELLNDAGIVLAQLGAHRFREECLEPLGVPAEQRHLIDASSFQDGRCASRFEEYRDIASALVVPKERAAEYRRCTAEREEHLERTERELPDGSLLVRYDPATGYGECIAFGSNGAAYANGGMSGAVAVDAMTGLPAPIAEATPAPTPVPAGAVAQPTGPVVLDPSGEPAVLPEPAPN